MQQFFLAKERYPETIVFFRMGDFYEMFYQDAVLASGLLDIALTSRGSDREGNPIPMAGVPFHAASGYIARLLEKGQRVAICEQMEDPSKVKGLVPREVVRVVTPGLVLDPEALDARKNNYLLAVVLRQEVFGLAAFELSTSEVRACAPASRTDLLSEMVRLDPSEVLVNGEIPGLKEELGSALPVAALREQSDEQVEQALQAESFRAIAAGLQGGAQAQPAPAVLAAAALVIEYAQQTQPGVPLGVQRIAPYDPSERLAMDDAAVRNLEIVRTLGGERKGSLIHLVDLTRTSMGARALRRRLLSPLCEVASIRRRHDSVEALVNDAPLRGRIRELLASVGDLERLATRATLRVATPRDLGAIRDGLRAADRVVKEIGERQQRTTDDALAGLLGADLCRDVFESLSRALLSEPPPTAGSGGIFTDAFDQRVAELRQLSSSSKDVILELEKRERERTGIGSLRIRFTRVFGYYIEVTKSNLKAVPPDYRRKQTVATGERYTTEELDELQTRILNADERLRALEGELFEELRDQVGAQSARLRALAARIADLDVHAALAETAHRHGYVRPLVDDSLSIDLRGSRHPIVEQAALPGGFVPNDIELDVDGQRLMVITGPNMAGKSTVMRQVALAVILGQAGGFVPADQATLGVVDRIYTRVGASDAVARGQSTFMVEMNETADILRGATRRSLVILDEIGRGTSTYDGLAIAWAVAEHLYDAIGCRSMFATHYHELCELAATRDRVVNYNVAAREYRNEVVFLRKLVPGGANRSYGIAVAKLAGLPPLVLARARAILGGLETGAALPSGARASLRAKDADGAVQLDMFARPGPPVPPSEAESLLRELDVEALTPLDAIVTLDRLKSMVAGKKDGEK
jgi:DNA mismatch repair protein MutS